MRLYLDTSVFGGYFEPEFEAWTKRMFERIAKDKHVILFSSLLELELIGSPENVRSLAYGLPVSMVERMELDPTARRLALEYVQAKVVGMTSLADCQHIAMATLAGADALVSWNFKHIVNIPRIRGYNSVNVRLGFRMIDIRTPLELMSDGN